MLFTTNREGYSIAPTSTESAISLFSLMLNSELTLPPTTSKFPKTLLLAFAQHQLQNRSMRRPRRQRGGLDPWHGDMNMGMGMDMPGFQAQGWQQPHTPFHRHHHHHRHQREEHHQPFPQPQAQQQAPATQGQSKDHKYPRFKNPFITEERPQGSYGKRAYVPGQETIRVHQFGERGDDPTVGWRMMYMREQMRNMNGQREG